MEMQVSFDWVVVVGIEERFMAKRDGAEYLHCAKEKASARSGRNDSFGLRIVGAV